MRMLQLFLAVSMLALFSGATIQSSGAIAAPAPVFAADPPAQGAAAPKVPDVDVHINSGGGERHAVWYINPVVLSVGAVVLILIIALIAMAGRGSGGTTIIRER